MGGLGGGGQRGTDLIRQEKWLQLQGAERILMIDMLDMLTAPMSKFWLLSYSDSARLWPLEENGKRVHGVFSPVFLQLHKDLQLTRY